MKRITIAVALMLVACTAHAEDESKMFVAGVAAAFSDYKGDASFPVSDSGMGMQFYAQARTNSWFAIEAGYFYSGSFEKDIDPANNNNVELSMSGFNIAAVGFIPILPNAAEKLELYGKLGLYNYDIDIREQGTSSSLGHSTNLLVGGGLLIHVSDNIGIRTDFNYYAIDNADLWSANLGIQFGF